MPVPQFSLRSTSKRFGDRIVLDGVDLSISPGEKVGVVGDNGGPESRRCSHCSPDESAPTTATSS